MHNNCDNENNFMSFNNRCDESGSGLGNSFRINIGNNDCCCNNNCGCGEERNLEREIREAIALIRRGIREVCQGLRKATRNNFCCGIKEIKEGICKIEAGLRKLIEALNEVDFECNSIAKCLIQDAICKIEKGLRDICEGLEALLNCDVCEGSRLINRGVCLIEEGLCEVEKSLCKIF